MNPLEQIPKEFENFPELIRAIIEIEKIFDDPEPLNAGTSHFTTTAAISGSYCTHSSMVNMLPPMPMLPPGAVHIPGVNIPTWGTHRGELEVEYTDNGVAKRRRVAPPYTLFSERLAEVKHVYEGSGFRRRYGEASNAQDVRILDHYLAQIMRGNIALGS